VIIKVNVRTIKQKIFQDIISPQKIFLRESLLQLPQHQISILFSTKAAERCKLNYSTAKIILRDLNHKERKFVRRLIRKKETN